MATKRGEKSKYELGNLGFAQKKDEVIERLILPTDSLQGIALLYNTSVAELKKLNHLHTEVDLHARRIIKVPAKGILVDLTEEAAVPVRTNYEDDIGDQESDEESTNGQVYLSNVDTVLKGIREKAEAAAASSPILNGSDESLTLSHLKGSKSDVKWWKVLLPCMGILIGFPIIYYLFLEQMEHIHHPGNATEVDNHITNASNVLIKH